jgi:hypothetical protein
MWWGKGQGRERRLEIRMRWPWTKVVEIAGHYFVHVFMSVTSSFNKIHETATTKRIIVRTQTGKNFLL